MPYLRPTYLVQIGMWKRRSNKIMIQAMTASSTFEIAESWKLPVSSDCDNKYNLCKIFAK